MDISKSQGGQKLKFYQNIYYFLECTYYSKVGDCSQGQPEGSLFNSYYTEV